jgi:flagella basal body P-ring formation protein FlgA
MIHWCTLRLRRFAHSWLIIFFGSVVLSGAGNPGQMITRDSIEPVLRQYVFERAAWKPENIEIRIIPFPTVTIPSGRLSFRVVQPKQNLTPGLQSLLLAVDAAGKEETRLWIKMEIRLFDNVVVSSYPLANHELVNSKAVRVERRDISSLYARPFTRIDDAVGQQAVRAIEVNEILTQKSVERPTLVKRGSAITLLYETGSLRIETAGTAEEAGKLGDFIQVKNVSSGKALRGMVLDGRYVKIN